MCIQSHSTNDKSRRALSSVSSSSSSSMSLPGNESIILIRDASASELDAPTSPIQEPLSPRTSLPIAPSSGHSNSRSVRFSQSVTSRPSLHKNNYTSKETAMSWYTSKEYEAIRRGIIKTIALMRSRDLVEGDRTSKSFGSHDDPTSSRGLENYTAKGSIKSSVRKLRRNAIWAILEEQDLQVERAECLKMTYLFYNDDGIRDVYQPHSTVAAQAARDYAIADIRAASETDPNPLLPAFPKHSSLKFMSKLFHSRSSSERHLLSHSSPKKHSRTQRRWSLLSSGKAAKG